MAVTFVLEQIFQKFKLFCAAFEELYLTQVKLRHIIEFEKTAGVATLSST